MVPASVSPQTAGAAGSWRVVARGLSVKGLIRGSGPAVATAFATSPTGVATGAGVGDGAGAGTAAGFGAATAGVAAGSGAVGAGACLADVPARVVIADAGLMVTKSWVTYT